MVLISTFIVLFVVTITGLTHAEGQDSPFKVNSVRVVDISGSLVRSVIHFDFPSSVIQNESFLHVLSSDEANHLSYISAKSADGQTTYQIKQLPGKLNGFVVFAVHLPPTSAERVAVVIDQTLTQELRPVPETASILGKQYVLWKGTRNVISVYFIGNDSTHVKIGNVEVLSYSEGGKKTKKEIIYESDNITPFASTPIIIHCENNSPLVVVTKLLRTVYVNHIGHVYVENKYFLKHKGARLEDEFSRIDVIKQRMRRNHVFDVIMLNLPRHAHHMAYYDEIGNISTSSIITRPDNTIIAARPRFPLVGGWKTDFIFGYRLPLRSVLFRNGSDFALKMHLFDTMNPGIVIEEFELKLFFSEGSSKIQFVFPFGVSQQKDKVYRTWLDIYGKPVYTIRKKNLIDQHKQFFTATYKYNGVYFVSKPIILSSIIFIFLMATIFALKLSHESKLHKLK